MPMKRMKLLRPDRCQGFKFSQSMVGQIVKAPEGIVEMLINAGSAEPVTDGVPDNNLAAIPANNAIQVGRDPDDCGCKGRRVLYKL